MHLRLALKMFAGKEWFKCTKLISNYNRTCYSTEENDAIIVGDKSPLTKTAAKSLIMNLTNDERSTLLKTLKEFESDNQKEEYKGKLAAFRWRSKFGRPTQCPSLGDVDPTGSYCPVPEDWLLKKYAESIPRPTTKQLITVGIHNAVPFIGFGFLDNFVMIICGDYIELKLGSMIVMSTMAAAALGNTLSDIMGIGSAYYVELVAAKIGVKVPDLLPIQLGMTGSKVASNLGRVIGVTIGCILGMVPLLFIDLEVKKRDEP